MDIFQHLRVSPLKYFRQLKHNIWPAHCTFEGRKTLEKLKYAKTQPEAKGAPNIREDLAGRGVLEQGLSHPYFLGQVEHNPI